MENKLIRQYRKLARIEMITVLMLGILVFCGWLFNVDELKKGIIGSVSMNPVTIVTLIVSIISFLFLITPQRYYIVAGKFLALVVVAIGALRIGEIFYGSSTGLTNWLFADKVLTDNFDGLPNTIAPNTAICIFLTGLSLLLYNPAPKKNAYLSDWFAMVAALVCFGSIIGYLYETDKLYTFLGYIPMALPTAVCYILFSSSLLLYNCEKGLFKIFTSPFPGSRMARYLVPFALVLPLASGIIRIYGGHHQWFTNSLSTAVIMMINLFVMIILIWRGASSMNRSAIELEMVRRQTEELNEQLRMEETRKMEQELLQAKINRQKELMQATIEGQEKEKKQLGMELHDHINQILASTKLYLELARSDEGLRMEMIQKCNEQVVYAINEIRNLSRSLVLHDTAKDAILENLVMLIKNVKQSSNMNIETDISAQAMNILDKKHQVSVYRIIEEQLQNILKHANAGNVLIRLWVEDNRVNLLVRDNGRGFDVNQKKKGIGLCNIGSRVASMDSDLEMISAPGNGCELRVSIPVSTYSHTLNKVIHY